MIRLRTRLLFAYVAALVPIAVVFGVLASLRAEREFEAELGQRLATAASMIAAQYGSEANAARIARLEPDSSATIKRIRDALVSAQEAADLRRVRIVRPSLETLVDTAETPRDERPETFLSAFDLAGDQVEIRALVASREPGDSVRFYAEDGTPVKRGYAPIVHDDVVVAIVVTEGSAAWFARLHGIRRALFGAGAFAILVVALVTALVSRRITAPLSRLAKAARQIGVGRFKVEIEVDESDEIGELANALRAMQRDLLNREEEAQMMLAGIAHEVRNPLGGMELFVGLLEESLEADTDARTYALRVRRELGYLQRVVEEFLAFARERSLESARVSASAFFAPVLEGCAEGVEAEIPADIEVSGDLDALRGVVQNVVQNARQATQDDAPVRIALRAEGRWREIVVADAGCGMSEEVLADVFRPFFTTREKGTGLGLPLAKKVVERHGGSIDVRSVEGSGTTVTLRLPFDPNAPEAAAERRTSRLRVDDEEMEMIG